MNIFFLSSLGEYIYIYAHQIDQEEVIKKQDVCIYGCVSTSNKSKEQRILPISSFRLLPPEYHTQKDILAP
jgi:hypothetical protein